MKIMVTGGAGYIGSHTSKALAKAGHTVVVYDNLSTGFRELARYGAFVHGDILDEAKLRATMAEYKPDGIIHFAASAYVGDSMKWPGAYFRNNVTGTLNILEAMRLEHVPSIVVSGTCAVYGQPEIVPIVEDCPKAPINPYGASKLFMERMLEDFHMAHGLNWVSLRYFNAAGCDREGEVGELHNPEPHIIPRIFMAMEGKLPKLEIFGDDYSTPDGTCVRDYIHVEDLALAHVRALEYLAKGGASKAFNVGTGNGFSVKQLVETAEKVTGKKVPHVYAPRRPGDPPFLIANPSLIHNTLGWQPACSDVETVMSSAYAWYIANNN